METLQLRRPPRHFDLSVGGVAASQAVGDGIQVGVKLQKLSPEDRAQRDKDVPRSGLIFHKETGSFELSMTCKMPYKRA